MKIFLFSTLFRLLVLTSGRIYLSSFQSELLYTTLRVANPATQAVNNCMSGIDSLSSTLHTKLDLIIQNTTPQTGTESIVMVSPSAINTTGNTITDKVKVIENLILPTNN